jgi:hemolysin activation/secretion protein
MTLLAVASCGWAYAQTTPGQLLQDIRSLQPQMQALPVPSPAPERALTPDEAPAAGQLQFVVKKFILVGNERVSGQDLQPLLSSLLGQPITYDDLKQATYAIAAHYRDQGLLARAVLPQQDITEGQVTIRIIESRLGGLAIDNRSERISNAQIQAWFDQQTPVGQVIELKTLDHALLTLGDLPTLTVDGFLQEGEQPGQTTLAMTVLDKPFYNGQVLFDNFGDKNTGTHRSSAQLNLNGLLNEGDQLNLYGLHTQGSDYLRAGWTTTAPNASRGQRIGLYASRMDYSIKSSAFQAARITGAAEVLGVEATDPLIRSRTANAMLSFNLARSHFKTWSDGVLSTDRVYSSDVAQLGVSGNQLDSWQGGGISVASLMLSLGHIDRVQSSDTNQVGGMFSKLRYGLSRTQNLQPDLSLFVSLTGQLAAHNMDSSEQLYLGGSMNVRAHASGQGAASQGQLYTVELRQQLPEQLQLAVFYDEGHAQTWKFNPSSNNVDNQYTLRGVGASLSWAGPQGVNAKAVWAQRVGQLSTSVSNAFAQSGGLDRHRLWLSASVSF